MPWLAIPLSDSETRTRFVNCFKVMETPHLVLLDENAEVITHEGVQIIQDYGVKGYPFTSEMIQELKDLEEKARKEQTIETLLCSPTRDYVVRYDGSKVPVSELVGKTVGLCFSFSSFTPSVEFAPKLEELHKQLKENGEDIEIVMISLDDDEESYKESFVDTWLALPVGDQLCEKLTRHFEFATLPFVVIIGPDGKTLHPNAAEAIEEYGIQAYPFTPQKFAELAEIEKAEETAQTLESILISGDLDFVIGKDDVKVKVSDLVGMTVLLYFSAHWCPPCRSFTPKIIEEYQKIKAKGEALEVVFISSDHDEASFEEYFSKMPWLALPFGDSRKSFLSRKFKVQGIPKLITMGTRGRLVTKETRDLIMVHGADAYPFTEERLKEIEAQNEEMTNGWPKKLKHKLHEEHELVLSRWVSYNCDGCNETGQIWSFYCEECNFILHPKCALEEERKETKADEKVEGTPEGWVCEDDVCTRA